MSRDRPMSQTTDSEAATIQAGRRLGASLRAGDVVLLIGQLGAGKTAFVRGIATGLGCDPSAVHSPSFAIVTEYAGGGAGLRLVHVDLYRLDSAAEVEDLALSEYLDGPGVLAVEWGERAPAGLRKGAIEVLLEHDGETRRRLTIRGRGAV